ncbi:MAG: glycosyltransferase family 2 protein [Algoriphagus sp.]|nr:glycosyltransferase family 2 protein [Algoriphagus sp.]
MISIVVCTHNGRDRLGACLHAIVSQENPPAFELIVVDNASTDHTGDWAEEKLKTITPKIQWKVIHEPKPGLLYARLAGLRAAHFEWVLFCDDDNILFPDFLYQSSQVLSKNWRVGVLGSHGIPEFLGPKPDWFDRYASSYAVGPQLGGNEEKRQLVFVYGACSIFRKNPLLNLFKKKFNPIISDRIGKELISGGDVEWCWLMQLLGLKVAYSPKLLFTHQLPASRLTWDYYLQLKRGISSSAGLLSTYSYFTSSSVHPLLGFVWYYSIQTLKAGLLYLKYRVQWKGNPSKPEDQLSYTILEAQFAAFRQQRGPAFTHYRQLLRYFGA